MKKLRIGVVDLVARGPTRAWFARVMNANLASIMPQVVGVWCREEGHQVTFFCYTGFENLLGELPEDTDLVFISAFTEAAQTAYALSNLFRSRGAITALGGPHARCYPQDALLYFDYVLGFTDREVLRGVLQDCSQHRPSGIHVTARQQPAALPGVRDRWPFIESVLQKAPFLKIVPMLGSLGCPYTWTLGPRSGFWKPRPANSSDFSPCGPAQAPCWLSRGTARGWRRQRGMEACKFGTWPLETGSSRARGRLANVSGWPSLASRKCWRRA
jgi:hypothetical protein